MSSIVAWPKELRLSDDCHVEIHMAKYWWSLVQFDAKTLTCPRERATIVGAAFGSVRRQLATLKV